MGYTHYWKRTKTTAKRTSKKTWKEFIKFVSELIEKVNVTNIENSADDVSSVAVVIKGGDGIEPVEINDDIVLLNGDDSGGEDLAHESFCLERTRISPLQFCKTNRKPYDPVVVACLIEADRLGIIDKWWSDGDEQDLRSGRELHRSWMEFNRQFEEFANLT
jgi:hypothetical protein